MDLEKSIRSAEGLLDKLAGLGQDPMPKVPVLFAKIKLLWQCNLACHYCRRPQQVAPMSRLTALGLMSALKAQGLQKVHFSGGEVFMHPEIFTILEDGANLGLQVNLSTNGTLLDRDRIRQLGAIGVHSMSVSLDSASAPEHDAIRGRKGAFKATMKAVKTIAAHPKKYPKLRINTVVTSGNVNGLDDLYQLITGLGAGTGSNVTWKLIPVDTPDPSMLLNPAVVPEMQAKAAVWQSLDDEFPFGRDGAEQDFFCAGKYGHTRSGCFIPWLHLFTDPSGYCYPCCMSRGKTRALGKYPEDSLDQILYGRNSSELRMNMAAGFRMKSCRRCDDFLRESAVIERLLRERDSNAPAPAGP